MMGDKLYKMGQSAEPIEFTTEKFLHDKKSDELGLKFSIRNPSQEIVTLSSIGVENLDSFVRNHPYGTMRDQTYLTFSKVSRKELERYPLSDGCLPLPIAARDESHDLNPGKSAVFTVTIAACARTGDIWDTLLSNSKTVRIFGLMAYYHYSKLDTLDIISSNGVQYKTVDKNYFSSMPHVLRSLIFSRGKFPVCHSTTKVQRETKQEMVMSLQEQQSVTGYCIRSGMIHSVVIEGPSVSRGIPPRSKTEKIIEHRSETLEQFLKRTITECDFNTKNELYSFADILKKKLKDRIIDAHLKDLSSKTDDTDFRNKISHILKTLSNEWVKK